MRMISTTSGILSLKMLNVFRVVTKKSVILFMLSEIRRANLRLLVLTARALFTSPGISSSKMNLV